jgi:hypothetical protein
MENDDRQPSRDPIALLRLLGSDMPAPQAAQLRVSERLRVVLAHEADGVSDRGVEQGDAHLRSGSLPRPRTLLGARAPSWLRNAGWALGGAAVASVGFAAFAPPRERVVYVDRIAEIASAGARADAVPAAAPKPAEASGIRAESLPVSGQPVGPPASVETSETAGERRAATSWTAERVLLDAARRDLASGDVHGALLALSRHGDRFPRGKLGEEREAMWVNALVRAGEYATARTKAEAFRRRYPSSFLASSVDAAIAAIP